MNTIELKDLEIGKEYYVAYRNDEGYFVPAEVKVVKKYNINFVRSNSKNYSTLELGKEYSIKNFWHESRGYDLYGRKFIMLWTFDNIKECLKWCVDHKKWLNEN